MSTDKLPAWPEEPRYICMAAESLDYTTAMTNAYRARMEALVEYAEHQLPCDKSLSDAYGWTTPAADAVCTCGLDALLAACDRRERSDEQREAGR